MFFKGLCNFNIVQTLQVPAPYGVAVSSPQFPPLYSKSACKASPILLTLPEAPLHLHGPFCGEKRAMIAYVSLYAAAPAANWGPGFGLVGSCGRGMWQAWIRVDPQHLTPHIPPHTMPLLSHTMGTPVPIQILSSLPRPWLLYYPPW